MSELNPEEFNNLINSMLAGGHKVLSTYHAKDMKMTINKIRKSFMGSEVNDVHIKSEDIFMETLDKVEENGKQ